MRWLKYLIRLILFVLLTILTQIGGLVYLLTVWLGPRLKFKFKGRQLVAFVLVYFGAVFLVVPPLAKLGGRVPIENSNYLKPANYLTVVLNRNYVSLNLNQSLIQLSHRLSNDHLTLHYLDANFPFIGGFPLLPHLSHNDGKKVDLALVYEDVHGNWTQKQMSNSGYGIFVEPKSHESNTTERCVNQGFFQYDFPKYLTLGKKNSELRFSVSGTRLLMTEVLKIKGLEKVFIEPHLKQRLNIVDSKIRFQGCHAVRHDDHIHLQIQ